MILSCSIEDAAAEEMAVNLLLNLNAQDIAVGIPTDKVEHGLLAADGVWPLLPVTVLEDVAHLDVVRENRIEKIDKKRLVRRVWSSSPDAFTAGSGGSSKIRRNQAEVKLVPAEFRIVSQVLAPFRKIV